MPKTAVAVILFFGVMLPTFDNYMDILIGVRMLCNYIGCSGEQMQEMKKIGISMIVVVCFSFLMIIRQWIKIEENKLKTLPLLLLQLWPQYRSVRVLYFGCIKKDPKWRKELAVIEKDVMTLEPLMESAPQLLIMSAAWYRLGGEGTCKFAYQADGGFSKVNRDIILFLLSWGTSLFSACYGVSKFLKVGPAGIIPTDKFCHSSFFLVFISVAGFNVGKGALYLHLTVRERYAEILFMYLPSLSYSIMILLISLGSKGTLRTILNHPSCVMTPVFSPWTFGPASSLSRDSAAPHLLWTNQPTGNARFLSVHFALTIGNFVVSTLGDFAAAWSIRKDAQLYPKLVSQGQNIFGLYIPLLMISFLSAVTVMLWSSFESRCCNKLKLEIRNMDTAFNPASSDCEKGHDEFNLRPVRHIQEEIRHQKIRHSY